MKINLAENMLRFGVKNLNETATRQVKTLAEQAKAPTAKVDPMAIKLPTFEGSNVYNKAIEAFKQGQSFVTSTADYIVVFNPTLQHWDNVSDSHGGLGVEIFAFVGHRTPAGPAFPFLQKVGVQSININSGKVVRNEPLSYQDLGSDTISELNADWGGSKVEKNPQALLLVSNLVNGPRFQKIADSINTYIKNLSPSMSSITTEVQKQIAAFINLRGAKQIAGKKLSELVGKAPAVSEPTNTTPSTRPTKK